MGFFTDLKNEALYGRSAGREAFDRQREQAAYDLNQQRTAALLKPLLNQYGPDAAKAIGSAMIAGGPASQMAEQRMAQQQQLQASRQPMDQQIAMMSPMQQAQMGSELALGDQRRSSTAVNQQQLAQAQAEGPYSLAAIQAQIRQRDASAQASMANRAAADSGRITQVQSRLNDRFLTQMDAPTQVADSVQQIDASMAGGDSLGALAATIKLAKILDPTSVVREGEVTTVQGGTGLAASLVNAYNKAGGKGMGPAQAAAFKRTVRSVAVPVLQRGLRIEGEVRKAAETMDADPEMAATGIGWPSGFVKRYVGDMPDPNTAADFEL